MVAGLGPAGLLPKELCGLQHRLQGPASCASCQDLQRNLTALQDELAELRTQQHQLLWTKSTVPSSPLLPPSLS